MPTLLQINSVVNWGSTGHIAEDIGKTVIKHGWKSYIAYGRYANPSQSTTIKIGNKIDFYHHIMITRLLDKHGLGSKYTTRLFIKKIDKIKPDIIHIHNLHGYYINYEIFFQYLKEKNIPVIWTFHDCWPFTGHCAHFIINDCQKWKSECKQCPLIKSYPASLFADSSYNNFLKKRELFTNLNNLTIVTVSNWLLHIVEKSFFKKVTLKRIYNGIDVNLFKPQSSIDEIKNKFHITSKYILLGVASTWTNEKGLKDYYSLSKILDKDYTIILIGVTQKQKKRLPPNILGICRTNNIQELVNYYSIANIVLNLSYAETFGLTTVEGFACGTPSIVYNCTASPELINSDKVGKIVEKGDIKALIKAIKEICSQDKLIYQTKCRQRALDFFNKNERYEEYFNLYKETLNYKK